MGQSPYSAVIPQLPELEVDPLPATATLRPARLNHHTMRSKPCVRRLEPVGVRVLLEVQQIDERGDRCIACKAGKHLDLVFLLHDAAGPRARWIGGLRVHCRCATLVEHRWGAMWCAHGRCGSARTAECRWAGAEGCRSMGSKRLCTNNVHLDDHHILRARRL